MSSFWHREGSANSDMGSRASLRDDDIARAEFVVDSARQAVGDLMRKIEQVHSCDLFTCQRWVHHCICAYAYNRLSSAYGHVHGD